MLNCRALIGSAGVLCAKMQRRWSGMVSTPKMLWPLRLLGWLVNRYIRLCEVTGSLLVAGDGPFIKLQAEGKPIILLVWHGRNFQAIPMSRLFISRSRR